MLVINTGTIGKVEINHNHRMLQIRHKEASLQMRALGLRTMDSQIHISAVVVLFHIISSAILSKEILKWEPSLVKRIALVLIVWLIPIVGGVVAYKHLGLDWFKKRSNKSNVKVWLKTPIKPI